MVTVSNVTIHNNATIVDNRIKDIDFSSDSEQIFSVSGHSNLSVSSIKRRNLDS